MLEPLLDPGLAGDALRLSDRLRILGEQSDPGDGDLFGDGVREWRVPSSKTHGEGEQRISGELQKYAGQSWAFVSGIFRFSIMGGLLVKKGARVPSSETQESCL